MRIMTFLARHGTATYGDAIDALDGFFSRQMPDVAHDLLVIDNALPTDRHERLGPGRTLIGGPNTHWEFSAWDHGIATLGEHIQTYDFVHLATSAFRALNTSHLDRIDAAMLGSLRGRAAALGHIDYYNETVAIGGRSLRSWMRSSFVFMPPTELRLLGSLVSVDDGNALFSGDPKSPFRTDAALSANYRTAIIDWLTGPGTGQGVEWHSRFVLSEETLGLFAAKTMAILNEQLMSARLRARGCALVDATWLSGRLAQLAKDEPLGAIPGWRLQIQHRDVGRSSSQIKQQVEQQAEQAAPRTGPLLVRPKAPPASAWDELSRDKHRFSGDPVVDVIVPVYRGYDDTLACLYSVLASDNTTAHEVVVINDCSPEQDLVAALEAIAARDLIHLVHNTANQGFVRSVNTGMGLHPQRDVILLNADTVVYGNWIDRMRAHPLADKTIGTVTPWSNNATLLSYPLTFANNDVALEIDFAALDRLVGTALAGQVCDLPTGVGFCLYLHRACLDDIGAFSDIFGRGYGEENDFCRRAAARGWRNIAACDVFVRHAGEVSFQRDAAEAQRQSAATMLRLHPDYMALIGAFLRADPLRSYRQALDLARLQQWGAGRVMLLFEASQGHATGLNPAEPVTRTRAAAQDDDRVLRVRPSSDGAEPMVIEPPAGLVLPNLPLLQTNDVAGALRVVTGFGAVGARVGSLRGYTPGQASFARTVCDSFDAPAVRSF